VINSNLGPFIDVPQEVARLVHEASGSSKPWDDLPEEKMNEKESKAKRVLCSRAAKHMTRTLLDDLDPDGEVLAWFEEMRNLIIEPSSS
jgi:putative ATP-dependent endonuclease of OLD family